MRIPGKRATPVPLTSRHLSTILTRKNSTMKRTEHSSTFSTAAAITLTLTLGCAITPALADDAPDVRDEIRQLRSLMESQQQQLDRQQQVIDAQQEALLRYRREHGDTWLDDQRAEEIRAIVGDVLADADTRASLLGSSMTAGWDRGFFLQSADGNYRLNIGGWIQPRYEYRFVSDDGDTSSFLLRRVRLDFQGHAVTPELTFRVMSEHARTSNLRDAWINYAFDRHLQVRFGQFTVPFQWHRDVSPRRQHFAERGVPSETFGFPTGRDVGIMFHGMDAEQKWKYGVGFFDGAGRNIATSNSDGNMVSARFTYALLGQVPREESDLAGLEEPNLSFAAGLQGAWRNEVRAWDLGRSAVGNERADWVTGTVGGHFAWKGFSLAADGYLRHVDPADPTVDSYDGWAWMVSAGYFIVPGRYEIVGRYSQLRLDSDDRDTREREWGVGFNIYFAGHNSKTRLNLLRHDVPDRHETVFLIEQHLQF
jgi:hypothetical protein